MQWNYLPIALAWPAFSGRAERANQRAKSFR